MRIHDWGELGAFLTVLGFSLGVVAWNHLWTPAILLSGLLGGFILFLRHGLPTVWQLRHPRQAWWMAHTGRRVVAEEAAYEAELRKAISEAKRAQWKARVGDAPPIVVNYRSTFGAFPVMPDLFEIGSPDPISATEDRAEIRHDEDRYPPVGAEVHIVPPRDSEQTLEQELQASYAEFHRLEKRRSKIRRGLDS